MKLSIKTEENVKDEDKFVFSLEPYGKEYIHIKCRGWYLVAFNDRKMIRQSSVGLSCFECPISISNRIKEED